MKHFYNLFKIICLFLFDTLFKVVGLFVLPIAVLFRKTTINLNRESNQECFSSRIIDFIYGNKYDGFSDIYYKRDYPIDTYWSRLNWCLLRNPTHNLGIFLGVNNRLIVKSLVHGNPNVTDDPFIENMGLKFQEVWDDKGKYYPMYYYCKMWKQILPFYKGDRGFRLLMGYKNFCVKQVNERYTYNFVCTITPFKLFVKG